MPSRVASRPAIIEPKGFKFCPKVAELPAVVYFCAKVGVPGFLLIDQPSEGQTGSEYLEAPRAECSVIASLGPPNMSIIILAC